MRIQSSYLCHFNFAKQEGWPAITVHAQRTRSGHARHHDQLATLTTSEVQDRVEQAGGNLQRLRRRLVGLLIADQIGRLLVQVDPRQ